MNIATDTAARNPSSRFFSINAQDHLIATGALSAAGYTVFSRLEMHSFLKDGTLPQDEKMLARLAGVALATFRKGMKEIMSLLDGVLLEIEGGTIRFLRAISERVFRQKKSQLLRENANKRWAPNPLKNNDAPDANASANAYANGNAEDIPLDSSPFSKEESPYSPPRGDGPGFGFPDLDETMAEAVKPAAAEAAEEPTPRAPRPRRAAKSPDGYPEEFMAAWKACPEAARLRSSQALMFEEWKRLSQEDRASLMKAISLWKNDGYAKGVHRWIKAGLWRSLLEVTAERAAKPKSKNLYEQEGAWR
jgi:hypothetical protein